MKKENHLIYFPDSGTTEKLYVLFDQFVIRNIPRGSKVLDIGCGMGLLSQKLARRAVAVTGIDLSEQDIERAHKGNINKRVTFDVMNGEDLKFEPEIFDIVVSRFVFHHLNEEIAQKQISRVLKKGGKLIVIDIINEFFWPHSRALVLLSTIVKMGLLESIKILPELCYFFKKERMAHMREDLKKLRLSHKKTLKDFRETYLKYYPGARIGRIFCAAYMIWKKP